MKKTLSIPKKSLKRLAHYHYYLKQMMNRQRDFVSNNRLASDLNLSVGEVREDLENLDSNLSMSSIHDVKMLTALVEEYLGYNKDHNAIIAGAGNLGKALLNYPGFHTCGLEIMAVFDKDPSKIGKRINGIEIMSLDKLEEITQRLKVKIGILTCPAEEAQSVTNKMVSGGIRGIWNFSLEILKVPEGIVLQNSSLYADFLRLSKKIEHQNEEERDQIMHG